jgi:hypothetical protein
MRGIAGFITIKRSSGSAAIPPGTIGGLHRGPGGMLAVAEGFDHSDGQSVAAVYNPFAAARLHCSPENVTSRSEQALFR